MKWLWTTVPVVFLFVVAPSLAADMPDDKTTIAISPGELAPTQDMWFYEQYQKQYTDPKSVVRQKAEFRAEERMRRITALRWFGFSNQRPAAGVDPINSEYGPHWSSGNVYFPFRWNGPAATTALAKPTATGARAY